MIATSTSGLNRQKEIYTNGFAGIPPLVPVDPNMLEEKAAAKMSARARGYIIGGAGVESTLRSNRSAFDQYKIIPRMLRNVSERDTSVELLGQKYASPFLLAPIGVLEL
ncbi:MAG: alpha-hydroxy-acid oxidizing protein, partial [Bacteroidota bacterium]